MTKRVGDSSAHLPFAFVVLLSLVFRKEGGDHDALLAKRKENYMSMVNSFYTLVTDFYEYGWGDSFHFANRFIGESHKESLRRAEYFLASKLNLGEDSKALDIGCGIGGPMRAIARFSGAEITGINNCVRHTACHTARCDCRCLSACAPADLFSFASLVCD